MDGIEEDEGSSNVQKKKKKKQVPEKVENCLLRKEGLWDMQDLPRFLMS